MKLLIANKSNCGDGQQFCELTCIPSVTNCIVARTLGSCSAPIPIDTKPPDSSAPQELTPRGRWYLKLLPTTSIPLASNAEATVSPTRADKV